MSDELKEAASRRWAKTKNSLNKHFEATKNADGYVIVRPKTRKGRFIAYLVYKLSEGSVTREEKGGKSTGAYIISIPKEALAILG